MFLRETSLTQPDAAITEFAETARAGKAGDTLALLHELVKALNREITFDTSPAQAATTAAEVFALRRGVCQDLTHIFIAAARKLGIPARYIGGHFYRADGVTAQDAGHAGAEAMSKTSAGLASIRPMEFPPPTPMCGWRRGWTILAPLRCAARAMAAAKP